jgi:hypothetical protein
MYQVLEGNEYSVFILISFPNAEMCREQYFRGDQLIREVWFTDG